MSTVKNMRVEADRAAFLSLLQGGLLMVIGSPLTVIGAVLSLLVFEALWIVVILGAFVMGLGLIWAGYALWSGKEAMKEAMALL